MYYNVETKQFVKTQIKFNSTRLMEWSSARVVKYRSRLAPKVRLIWEWSSTNIMSSEVIVIPEPEPEPDRYYSMFTMNDVIYVLGRCDDYTYLYRLDECTWVYVLEVRVGGLDVYPVVFDNVVYIVGMCNNQIGIEWYDGHQAGMMMVLNGNKLNSAFRYGDELVISSTDMIAINIYTLATRVLPNLDNRYTGVWVNDTLYVYAIYSFFNPLNIYCYKDTLISIHHSQNLTACFTGQLPLNMLL